MSKENNAIVKLSDWAIMKADPELVAKNLQENLGLMGLDQSMLTKVVWPSGKAAIFNIPGVAGDENVETIRGVIVGFKDIRAFWKSSLDDGGSGTPPDCTSDDLSTGFGNPGGACLTCPYSQFDSAQSIGKKGKGQACQQRRVLFVLRENGILPVVTSIPPTSIKLCAQFFIGLVNYGLPYYGGIVELGLNKTKNQGGIEYCEATFKLIEPLQADALKKLSALTDVLKPYLQATKASQVVAAQNVTVNGGAVRPAATQASGAGNATAAADAGVNTQTGEVIDPPKEPFTEPNAAGRGGRGRKRG